MRGYPKWFTATFVNLVMALALVSGSLLAPTTAEMRLGWNLGWRLGIDQRTLVATLHVLGGLALFFVLGALVVIHMRIGWREKSKRLSGLLVSMIIVLLGSSGIGIYYLAVESLINVNGLIHTGLGLAVGLIYAWHLFLTPGQQT